MATILEINADQYIDTREYVPHGRDVGLDDGTRMYVCGKSPCKHGVIVIQDLMEWDTGRIRNICDFFGDHDHLVVIPDFPSHGIDGNPQAFREAKSLMDWYKSCTFDGNIKPTIQSVLAYMKQEGIDMICLLGFAWGSWVVTNLLAYDLASEFRCGALCSPTLELEETIYGGSVPALLHRVQRPVLLMPTMGDAEFHRACVEFLSFTLPSSKLIECYGLADHFMLRGDSEDNRIRDAIYKSLNDIHLYFQEHYAMTAGDLLREMKEQMLESMNGAREALQQSYARMTEHTGTTGGSGSSSGGGMTLGERTKSIGAKVTDFLKSAFSSDGKKTEEERGSPHHQVSG